MTVDLHGLRAKDAMSREVQWALPHENLRAASQRMAVLGIRALLVPGKEPIDLPGIITSKDIVNLLGTHDASVLDELLVSDVMTRPAICLPAQTNLRDCINLMRMSGVRRMPVLEGIEVIGILSTTDVLAHALRDS